MSSLPRLTRLSRKGHVYTTSSGLFIPTGDTALFVVREGLVGDTLTLTARLKHVLKRLVKFTATGDLREFLNGICFDRNTITALDGHRLLQTYNFTDLTPSIGSFIIPIAFIRQLLRLPVWDNGTVVHVAKNPQALQVLLYDGVLLSSLIEAQMPNIDMLYGRNLVDVSMFSLTSKTKVQLRLRDIEEKKLHNDEYKEGRRVRLGTKIFFPSGFTVEYGCFTLNANMEEFNTAINLDYLLDFPEGTFTVRCQRGKPCKTPPAIFFESDEFTGLVMPMRL